MGIWNYSYLSELAEEGGSKLVIFAAMCSLDRPDQFFQLVRQARFSPPLSQK